MKEYLDSVTELESPQSYFYWAMLTTISSVVGRKVYIDRGGVYKLYPNIYTFLISKRSGLRKGVPVNVAKKLAHEVGKVRVIDGQNSIQGVLKELSQVRTVGNGHVIKNAEGFLITGEFASFLLGDGLGFSLTTLTDLYDAQYHEHGYKKRLASQDELELKNLCLTALFASNETHFFDSVPKNAIAGGFLARTFCVYEEKRNTVNSLTKHVEKQINYKRIIVELLSIAKLEGQIIAAPGALKAFDDWYYQFCSKDHEEEDETGTSERIGDSIWKAAILICLSNGHYVYDDETQLSQIVIEEEDMDEAIVKSIETFTNLRRLLLGGSSSDTKNLKTITMRTVTACLLEAAPTFEVGRKKILRKGCGMFGVYDLDEAIEYLIQAGMIKLDKRGSETYYKLTESVIKRHISDEGKEKKGD